MNVKKEKEKRNEATKPQICFPVGEQCVNSHIMIRQMMKTNTSRGADTMLLNFAVISITSFGNFLHHHLPKVCLIGQSSPPGGTFRT